MKLDLTHSFSKDEAVARLKTLTEYWGSKYGVKSRWDDDQAHIAGKVSGVKFEGDFRVADDRVTGDVKAGFLAEKLGGKRYVEDKLADYLDPSNSLESLKARR